MIATTPSYIFPRLVPELPDDYLAKLTGLSYLSAVLIILELDRSLSPVYWLNVADRSIPFVGVIEHTRLIGPEHYGGKHIVYLSNYLSRDHLSVISGITPQGKLYMMVQQRPYKGPDVVNFLRHLLRHIPGKLLVLWCHGACLRQR